ncbi:NAD-dependent epimerase/dehydratase family protein [Criblamydia sequanensis]|uniref:NAD-dependent epimerase/dehydratase n=1 Tax=Candidatus Criblamydia sequanensis CRIB-18 TaxID=1437425 RepID=A0A090CYA7_9BACT|nr:NAD(P)-dependent oxidoreductase [Criblamydia sequanensis]CDR33246.1 NAD-dependent epimerase/dehydratase [Criblamydia sequanensis CRIB-18]
MSLKIFIAGAGGAIGLPLISYARQKGYQLFAATRNENRKKKIESLGAEAILLDVLDEKAVHQNLEAIRPDVIIDVLTSLPQEYTPSAMQEYGPKDAEVRTKGGGHLLKSAIQLGVKRYLLQSAAFWYEQGEGLAIEETPFAFKATPGIAAGTKLLFVNETRLKMSPILSTILRYGFFYGPKTWFEKDASLGRQAREGKLPLVDHGNGIWNFVHIEDAAKATIDALDAKEGTYNINDSNPIEFSKWLNAFCKKVDAPPPITLSQKEYRKNRGDDFLYYATSLRGASNEKAIKELKFNPRPLEWL